MATGRCARRSPRATSSRRSSRRRTDRRSASAKASTDRRSSRLPTRSSPCRCAHHADRRIHWGNADDLLGGGAGRACRVRLAGDPRAACVHRNDECCIRPRRPVHGGSRFSDKLDGLQLFSRGRYRDHRFCLRETPPVTPHSRSMSPIASSPVTCLERSRAIRSPTTWFTRCFPRPPRARMSRTPPIRATSKARRGSSTPRTVTTAKPLPRPR